jgi:hypothetical protein
MWVDSWGVIWSEVSDVHEAHQVHLRILTFAKGQR